MQVEQNCWEPNTGWKHPPKPRPEVQLVLGFGSRQILENPEHYLELKQMFPSAQIACCSTAGEIQGDQVRVSGKKRDDLQDVIAEVRELDFRLPLQFINFRD